MNKIFINSFNNFSIKDRIIKNNSFNNFLFLILFLFKSYIIIIILYILRYSSLKNIEIKFNTFEI